MCGVRQRRGRFGKGMDKGMDKLRLLQVNRMFSPFPLTPLLYVAEKHASIWNFNTLNVLLSLTTHHELFIIL